MATRFDKEHDERTRLKIKTSQLINRLNNHALGEIEMTASQIRAAEILLNKTLPNLAAMQVTADIQVSSHEQMLDQLETQVIDGESATTH